MISTKTQQGAQKDIPTQGQTPHADKDNYLPAYNTRQSDMLIMLSLINGSPASVRLSDPQL